MITPEKALEIILEEAYPLGSEKVDLTACLSRFLAEDVVSDMDMPPFNKSAMDGFACRKEDLGRDLEIMETLAAGQQPSKSIGMGQCSRIMTGAMVPDGADCVIKVEETMLTDAGRIRFTAQDTRSNIAHRAEDIRKGETVLHRGEMIKPQHIAVLASVGCTRPLVCRKPRVAVISTGNEIVEPWEKPGPTQIRNSNSYQLLAQVTLAGGIPEYAGIAPDEEETSFRMMEKALKNNDILLLTGGVSMGDFDFIPGVIERTGATIRFKTISIQPGKPTIFATLNKKRIFGLPGNPVSSHNIFLLLVLPLIRKMMGNEYRPVPARLPLSEDYKRKKADRTSWIPVRVSEDGKIYPLEYHGSAHVHSLAGAGAIAGIPAGTTELKAGDYLDVRFI